MATPAAAAAPIFHLPAAPLATAIVRFAIQAQVSVGGLPPDGCGGRSRPVEGPMAPAEALRRLLPPGCGFEMIDARSFRIVARPAGPPPPTLRSTQATAPPPRVPPSLLDAVIVTAEKHDEPLAGSAFAISVRSGAELAGLGARSIADAAIQLPSVAVTNLGPGRNKIFIRGLSDGAFTGLTQSTVGLYLDAAPITYSAPDPDLRLVDIDHVEVLKGPQGSLYGSGSIGGIVRIVTTPPNPDRLQGEVSAELASSDHGGPSRALDGVLNLPLPAVGGAMRIVAYRDDRGGYIDNPVLGLTDVNASKRSGLRVSAVAVLPAGWSAGAVFVRQGIYSRDSQYTQGAGALVRDTQVREPHDNDFTLAGGSLIHQGETARLALSATVIDHRLDTRYDASDSLGVVGPAAFDEARKVDLTVADAVLTSAGDGRWRWLAGLFAADAQETATGRITAVGDADPGRSVYRRQDHLSEEALYGEAAFALTRQITVTAGGRLFASRQASRIDELALAPEGPGPLAPRRVKAGGFAPKLRVSYALRPTVLLYAQFQEGYRAGGFNLPASAGGQSGGDPAVTPFKPDRLLNSEAGLVWPLDGGRVELRAAVFRAAWKHVQSDEYRPSGLPTTVNIGDAVNTGVEAEVAWRPDTHWRLRANLLAEDPEITRVSNAFPAITDVGLPGVARLQGAAEIRYGWAMGGLQGELSAQASYVGRSHLTFDGAASNDMGGYGVGRAAFALEGGRWRLEAYVDNLTDTVANTFSFGNPFGLANGPQATPLRPRTVGVVLGRRF